MTMFLFNRSVPERDGALENDLVVHENTHGITNRMTGGGTGRYVKHIFYAKRWPQCLPYYTLPSR